MRAGLWGRHGLAGSSNRDMGPPIASEASPGSAARDLRAQAFVRRRADLEVPPIHQRQHHGGRAVQEPGYAIALQWDDDTATNQETRSTRAFGAPIAPSGTDIGSPVAVLQIDEAAGAVVQWLEHIRGRKPHCAGHSVALKTQPRQPLFS